MHANPNADYALGLGSLDELFVFDTYGDGGLKLYAHQPSPTSSSDSASGGDDGQAYAHAHAQFDPPALSPATAASFSSVSPPPINPFATNRTQHYSQQQQQVSSQPIPFNYALPTSFGADLLPLDFHGLNINNLSQSIPHQHSAQTYPAHQPHYAPTYPYSTGAHASDSASDDGSTSSYSSSGSGSDADELIDDDASGSHTQRYYRRPPPSGHRASPADHYAPQQHVQTPPPEAARGRQYYPAYAGNMRIGIDPVRSPPPCLCTSI